MSAEPIHFSNEGKLRRQMAKRSWSDEQLREALATTPFPASGKQGPALRYVHPLTGKSAVVDAATGQVFHVGDVGFVYD